MKTKMNLNRIDKMDRGMRFLIRFNVVMFTTLFTVLLTYYRVKDEWNLDHDTSVIYSFTVGLTLGFIVLISLRRWRLRNVQSKKSI
jgi:hypothetical protein